MGNGLSTCKLSGCGGLVVYEGFCKKHDPRCGAYFALYSGSETLRCSNPAGHGGFHEAIARTLTKE